jgi:proline dehydrogenase
MGNIFGNAIRKGLQRIGRAYIAGDTVADAERVAKRWRSERGMPAVYGYWDMDGEPPESVARQYLASVAATRTGDYVSIKAPGIDYSVELFQRIAEAAAAQGTHLHVDAEGPETIDRAKAFADRVLPSSPVKLGWTLPGRWLRSVSDAHWVGERGLRCRIVKGQWPDPAAEDQDFREGYKKVATVLSGYRSDIGMAGHDVLLSEHVGEMLQTAGVRFEMELLFGLPWRSQLDLATRKGWPARIYVGYGREFFPYAVRKLKSNPRMMWWIARDVLGLNR